MVLSTEWSQVEVIDLVNDGSGLGFGIVGGRSTGVVVKSILPGIQRRIQIAHEKILIPLHLSNRLSKVYSRG